GDDRSAKTLSPRLRNAAFSQFGVFTQGRLPIDLAAIHVNRVQQPPRRFDRRIAFLINEAVVAAEAIGPWLVGRRDQVHHARDVVGVGIERSRFWVERRASPTESAVKSWKHDRSLQAQRREYVTIAHLFYLIEDVFARFLRDVGDHLFSERLRD